MAKGKTQTQTPGGNGGRPQGQLDFEPQLWAAADKLRGHMDASEYKHVCLGLIFLKYISDAFEEKREQLLFGLLPAIHPSSLRFAATGDSTLKGEL